MATLSTSPVRFGAGSVLSRTFSVWARNAVPFGLLGLLVHLPLVVIAWTGSPIFEAWWGGIAEIALRQGLSLLLTGLVAYGVVMHLRGAPVPVGRCLSVGLSQFFPVLGVGLLVVLWIILGYAALIIPGVIVTCMLWVAVPAAVLEKQPVREALRRSQVLTKGYRMAIFLVLLALGIIGMTVGLGVYGMIVGTLLFDTGDVISEETLARVRTANVVVNLLDGVIFGPLAAVAAAVGYHDLRRTKEGVGVEELAKVFE